jgi:hypothetical protein
MTGAQTFTIGGPLRLSLGLLIAVLAGSLINIGRYLDWGLAWIMYIPAVAALMVALNLVRRTRLRLNDQSIELETGWLWRRSWRVNMSDSQIELVPMSGLWSVVVHRGDREFPLALWLGRRRAEALITWLDQAAPDGAWPKYTRPA